MSLINKMGRLLFTVDVECGISLTMRDAFNKSILPTKRVVYNTLKVLDILDSQNIKGTFFVVGIVAKIYPELVKEIYKRGHEVGAHGHNHYVYNKLTYKEALYEVTENKNILEDILGDKILGHRAPEFSINNSTSWVLDILCEAGFKYDSSIRDSIASKFIINKPSSNLYLLRGNNNNEIFEIPILEKNILGYNIPVIGGRYFQILPYFYSKNMAKGIINSRDCVFYMHPYEIDTKKYPDYYYSNLRNKSLAYRIKTYAKWANRNSFEKKIISLIEDFEFTTIAEYFDY